MGRALAAFALAVTLVRPFPGESVVAASALEQEPAAIVEISNFAFAPDTVTIAAGQSVAWVNRDSAPHTITAPGFDTGRLSGDTPGIVTFDTAGEFSYNCGIHASMAGTIIVE
jgi:plastocyanin